MRRLFHAPAVLAVLIALTISDSSAAYEPIAIQGAANASVATGTTTVLAVRERQPGLEVVLVDVWSRTTARLHIGSEQGVPATDPRIAFDGQRFLVIWEEIGATHHELRGAFVSEAGMIDDSFLITTSQYVYLGQARA